MFAVGAAAAARIGVARYALAQVMVTASQLTAHYVNEYADVDADQAVANRTMFSGGSGVLVSGGLGAGVALQAAFVTTGLSVAAAVGVGASAPLAAGLGLVTLAVSWAYSIPPVRLLGTGWGELATSLTVAGLVPLIGVTSMGSSPSEALWWAVGILVPIHVAMMLVFELPDLESDALVGKRVLAVRLGEERTRAFASGLLAAAAATGVAADGSDAISGATWAVVAGVVPAAVLLSAMRQRQYGTMTAAAVATLVVVAAGLLVAIAS
jgi:1,4-dihydroxy-2-naphthoate octaprenyltransferase